MIYKLSNVAELEEIEYEFGIPYKYPNLYAPQPIINGFREENLSIITLDKKHEIQYAIWGLMPNGFKDEWIVFQNLSNTLNVPKDNPNNDWVAESLENDRCLIIVTGFYTFLFEDGHIKPFLITLKDNRPFYLAGVYSVLEDGFLSCAVVTTGTYNEISKFHDISDVAPLIISKTDGEKWLSTEISEENAEQIVNSLKELEFSVRPVPKKLFEKNLTPELVEMDLFPFSLN